MSGPFVISAFYKFVELTDHADVRDRILDAAVGFDMVGSILVAGEGINATVAGERAPTDAFMKWLREDPRFVDVAVKESYADFAPFKRMKVRRKREIVTFHQQVDPTTTVGTYVDPADWDALIADPTVLVIDARNDEEVRLGTFRRAVNPATRSFTEFAGFVAGLDPSVHRRVAMFCTGGIRCEKASSYLLEQGFPEVFHLEGGILNYLEAVPPGEGLWDGELFVFDDRVTVDRELRPGTYSLCRGCRRVVAEPDRTDAGYEEGVSCRACVAGLSAERREALRERHRQVQLAEVRGERHIARRT